MVFELFTDLSRFADKLPEDKKEQVTLTPDSILTKVQGMEMGVQVVQRVAPTLVVLQQYGNVPFSFTINVNLNPTPEGCTLQLDLDAELNMMFKMMLGGKLKELVNQFSAQLAAGLNQPIPSAQV